MNSFAENKKLIENAEHQVIFVLKNLSPLKISHRVFSYTHLTQAYRYLLSVRSIEQEISVNLITAKSSEQRTFVAADSYISVKSDSGRRMGGLTDILLLL